jgi:hypothetical protein
MKSIAALAAAGVIALAALGLRELGVWGDESFEGGIDPPSLQLSFLGVATDRAPAELSEDGTACERLAGVTTDLGRGEPSPAELLRALGLAAAGIRPPPRALADLAAGGRDRIPGGGFRPIYSDGTAGQARHFAGVAVATLYGGAAATRVASIFLRRDPARSADGRLSERALEFASLVSLGELPIEQAGPWILVNVCEPTGLVPSGPDEG